MQIVYIDSDYTDFLFKADNRVSKNINKSYQRPYIGVLFKIEDKKYFAPLTSTKKGQKLSLNPVPENATFFPIDDCKLGGVNINNMIPVVDSAYWLADLDISPEDAQWLVRKKIMLRKTIRFLRKHEERLILKAKFLYNKSCEGKLSEKQSRIVCDFKRLEEAAKTYNMKPR